MISANCYLKPQAAVENVFVVLSAFLERKLYLTLFKQAVNERNKQKSTEKIELKDVTIL